MRRPGVRRSTMRDVSRATGLSIFTVSRALNGGEGVSDASREHVRKAARELGYIPNRAAQELRRASRDSVAVITASTSNSYYLDLMSGIQQALRPSEWTIVVGDVAVDGAYDPCLEDRMVQRLIESRVAGVVSTLTLHEENLRLLEQWDIPVVFVDSSPPAVARHLPSVTTNNYAASLSVGEHLAQHGYKEWLFLLYPATWTTRFDRERGMRDAAAHHGAQLTVLESGNDAASAYSTLRTHLEKQETLPRVLIAGNNPLLLGALNCARDLALRIPDDLALIGFDEFAWAALIDPPLTVLNESSEQIGREAANTLARIIEGQTDADARGGDTRPQYRAGDTMQIPAQLIIRRSCGCKPAARN